MTRRAMLALACAAAACAGCGRPAWVDRDAGIDADTRRMAEEIWQKGYLPPQTSGGRSVFVRVAAVRLPDLPGEKPAARSARLGKLLGRLGRAQAQGLEAMGLEGRTADGGVLENLRGAAGVTVTSKSFAVRERAPGFLSPPGGSPTTGPGFTAELAAGGVVVGFGPGAGSARGAVTVPAGGAAVVLPRGTRPLEGLGRELMSSLTGEAADALVIVARPMR